MNPAKAAALPEEVGIGSLSADNLKGMAGGGIVAFEEGGEVPGFADGGKPPSMGTEYGVPGMTQSNMYQAAMEKLNRQEPLSDVEKALLFTSSPFAAAADVGLLPINALRNLVRNPLDTSPRPSLTPVSDAREKALYGDYGPVFGPGSPGYSQKVPVTATGQAPAAALAGGRTDLTAGNTANYKDSAVLGAAPGAGGAGPGISALRGGRSLFPKDVAGYRTEYEAAMGEDATKDPFSEERQRINAARTAAAEADLAEYNKDMESRGVAFADRERRLKTREEELTKQKDVTGGLALLEAGLSMMAGTSRHAFENIGKGAQVGVKSYREGMDKITAAQEKLDDAYGRIEEFRRNEDTMTAKDRRALKSEIKKSSTAGLESLLSGMEKAYGYSREEAKNIVSNMEQDRRTQFEQEQQNLRTASTNAAHLQGIKAQMEMNRMPMLMQRVEADVDKWAKEALKYETDDTVREQKRQAELMRRLQSIPGLAQYAPGPTGGGGAPALRYNPQTGKIE